MKTLAITVAVALLGGSGCDKHQTAPAGEAATRPAMATASPSPVVVVDGEAKTLNASTAPESSCSGEMTAAGSECSAGSGGCSQWDEAAGEVARRPVPTDAAWSTIAVEGMTCGGCERRVIANVGQIEGVLAVEADAELGQVRVAMAPGNDLRGAAVERINSLGYKASNPSPIPAAR